MSEQPHIFKMDGKMLHDMMLAQKNGVSIWIVDSERNMVTTFAMKFLMHTLWMVAIRNGAKNHWQHSIGMCMRSWLEEIELRRESLKLLGREPHALHMAWLQKRELWVDGLDHAETSAIIQATIVQSCD